MEIGGLPAVMFVAKRARFGGMTPYIFTSTDPSDDAIADLASSNGLPCFRGDLLNKVKRWTDGFNEFELSSGHLVDVDDPFFDPASCVESFRQLTSHSEIGVLLPPTDSDGGEAYVGTSVRLNTLEAASSRAMEIGITHLDVVPWRQLVDEGVVVTFANREGAGNEARFRLTLDYQEDYDLLSYLGGIFPFSSSRSDLESFLLENKKLTEINMFRNEDFHKNKIKVLKTQLRKMGR